MLGRGAIAEEYRSSHVSGMNGQESKLDWVAGRNLNKVAKVGHPYH